jgi:hypothetical protein
MKNYEHSMKNIPMRLLTVLDCKYRKDKIDLFLELSGNRRKW